MADSDAEQGNSVMELREAIDDLWACIAWKEMQDLQITTIEVARTNHNLLHH